MKLLGWLLPFALIAMMPFYSEADGTITNNNMITIKTETFLSPLFTSTPGLVIEKFYYHINFPRGHIAMKSFNVEVVDEAGNVVPLSETYLHHWALLRYYQHKNAIDPNPSIPYGELHEPDYIIASNNGVCQPGALAPYYAMGSESRNLSTFLPHPYGIEVGNAAQVPKGYEERWSLNVHAIDIRGAEENKLGCMECRCHLYNITKDRFGQPLRPDYKGGFECCYDKTECRVNRSYGGKERKLYARYTVKWVDWDDFLIPVKVYLFDVTDNWKPLPDSASGSSQEHHCRVEYDVEPCSPTNKLHGKCNAMKMSKVIFPDSGFLVYGVAHQHIGATGATFHGEDGRGLCSSSPIYGKGNDEGYVVGMTTCYPQPGSVKINKGEMVTIVSNYDSAQNHTGVMGLFQIVVADKVLKSSLGSVGAPKMIAETIIM